MTTVEDLVHYYFLFVTAIFYIYLLVDTCSLYFWKEEEEEDDDDIELGDDDHCCRICHEDIRAFSDIIRLSKCDSIRSMFTQLKRFTK